MLEIAIQDVKKDLTWIKAELEKQNSPKITSKRSAARFLKYGTDHFEVDFKAGMIPHHVDTWGQIFFLKHELVRLMEKQ